MIKSVGIEGAGQVGTSIAAALSQNAPDIDIHLFDAREGFAAQVLARFEALSIPTTSLHFHDSAKAAAANVDLVILATPISAFPSLVAEIKDSIAPGTIVTDTGSAKKMAITNIAGALEGSGIVYVPAHPGNGSQGSGPSTGSPGNILGPNSWMFLIDAEEPCPAQLEAISAVSAFWKNAGVNVTTTDADTHDSFFGTCSHLQHAIVFSQLNTAHGNPQLDAAMEQGGTALRNLTRVAISARKEGAPSALVAMWQPIFEQNKNKILPAADNFLSYLDKMRSYVEQGQTDELRALLTEAHVFRKGITDLEPRENVDGEIEDIAAAVFKKDGLAIDLKGNFDLSAINNLYANLLLPLAIGNAQALNARDVDAELVQGKANPSFRDGTAPALYNPDVVTDILMRNSEAFLEKTAAFREQFTRLISYIRTGNQAEVGSMIEQAQDIRNTKPGPRKNADTRPEYHIPKVV